MLEDLTVICCAYNAQNTIHSAISSVLDNLNQGMKLIVVNDCSTDYTRDIVLDFNHPNITLIDNEVNIALGSAKNVGMDNVQTEYFGFLDADDWVSDTYFGNLMYFAKKIPEADVLLALQYVHVNHRKRTITNSADVPLKYISNYIPLDVLVGDVNRSSFLDIPLMQLMVYKTSFINQNNVRCTIYRTAEDRNFIWSIVKAKAQFSIVRECGYFYDKTPNPNALSQTVDIIQLDFLRCYSEILVSIRETGKSNYINKVTRQIIALIDLNTKRGYSSEVLDELYHRASKLVKLFTREEFDFLYNTVNDSRKKLLNQLKGMGD